MNLGDFERDRVLTRARKYLNAPPTPITSLVCARSPGAPQDYFSEGDYWWRNPDTAEGLPYIRRDGETNPDNFFGHRRLMITLSVQVGALGAAYALTRDPGFSDAAAAHLHAWFVNLQTR